MKSNGLIKDSSYYSILFIFLSTAVQGCFGFARNAPPVFKLLIALLCWISVYYAYKSRRTMLQFPKVFGVVYKLLLLNCVIAFIHSLIWGSVSEGNKYVVLMTNMYGGLNIVGVIYVLVFQKFEHFRTLLKFTISMFFLNAILLVVNFHQTTHAYFLSYFLIYAALFLPYINKKQKLYIAIGTIMAMSAFFGGGRQVAISVVFMLGSWLGPKFTNKRIIFYVSLALLVLPLFYIWFYGSSYGSIFWYLESNVSDTEELSGNTRTFLYVECMNDFFLRDWLSQIFGQGALAEYDSPFFWDAHRFGIEVPILQWIMQCGIVNYVLFTAICAISQYRLYKDGNNKMCMIMSLLIGAFYFMCHVSNFTGCNTMHLGFWGMIGMSINPRFTAATDMQIFKEFTRRA